MREEKRKRARDEECKPRFSLVKRYNSWYLTHFHHSLISLLSFFDSLI